MTLALAPAQTRAPSTPASSTSLPLRVVALVAGLLLLFACASVGMQAWTLAQALQVEQTARNAEAVQVLADAWSRPRRDLASLPEQAQARYALGREDRIHVQSADGGTLIRLDRPAADTGVPDWFAQAWPIAAPPGRISLVLDGAAPAVLEAESGRAWAHQVLWRTVSRSAVLLALFAAAASLLAVAVLRGWLLPWRTTLGPLYGLAAGPSQPLADPSPPEARERETRLAQGMQATVRDLRHDLAMQTEQVLRLQRQAQLDAMTGVSLRHHFLGQLQRRLADPQGGRAALLIVRVCDLEALNLRAGREATDRLLCAVAHVLLTYVDRVAGALAGRLNGGDFALCLPVGGVALETATSLRDALAALPALRTAGAQAVVGGVDDVPHTTSSLALAQADAALARAEAGEADGVAVDRCGDLSADAGGASTWRLQLAEALTQERGRLQHTPVQDREGRTLHLLCALHLQLAPGAAHEAPRRWLALARRARLLPRVDLLTVRLALSAIAADGRLRCVRLTSASWSTPGFVAAVRALLQAAPTQAQALAVELAEPESGNAGDDLSAAVAAWAPCGVRLGVGHGTVIPADLTALHAAGIAFVTVAGEHLRGVAADAALQAYAQGWLQLVRELGLLALAGALEDPRDLDVLWALGLDGAAAPPAAV